MALVPPAPVEPARPVRAGARAAAPTARARRLGRGRVLALAAGDGAALAAAVTATAWATGGGAAGLLGVPVVIALLAAYGLYDGPTRTIAAAGADEVGPLFHALATGALLLLVAGEAAPVLHVGPLDAGLFVVLALAAVPAARAAVRSVLLPRLVRPRRALVVGAGRVGSEIARKLAAHPEWGLELVGFVDDDPVDIGPGTVLGRTADLTRIVEAHDVDWVLLAFSRTSCADMLEAVRAVRRPDVHLAVVPNYFELFASHAAIEDVGGIPVVSLPPLRLSRPARTLKRAVDVVASAAGLLLLSPLLAACALAVRLDGPGPVLFRQERHGRGGSRFRIAKFRTMRPGAEASRPDHLNAMVAGPLFKAHEDPRVTRVGRVLRRTSLDELPQLWNVLRGDMSLVGPRPFVVGESEQIMGWAERRLDTTPGITGLWQVSGRSDVGFEEMVRLDYVYVTNWSLWWDAKILLRTLPAVVRRRGAY